MDESIVTVETKPCPLCGRSGKITMPESAHAMWLAGRLLQRAWPEASPEEREMLITGTHPDCWDAVAGEEE